MNLTKVLELSKKLTHLKKEFETSFWTFETDHDFVSFYETKLKSEGYTLVFPILVNPDYILTHRTPTHKDKILTRDMSLVSIDIGLSDSEGNIVDTAVTLTRTSELKLVLDRYRRACDKIESLLVPNMPIKVLSRIIEHELNLEGFEVHPDFHGHYIEANQLHADPTVFNSPAFSENQCLRDGFFTIEPHCVIGLGPYHNYECTSNVSSKDNYYVRKNDSKEVLSLKTTRLNLFEERYYTHGHTIHRLT